MLDGQAGEGEAGATWGGSRPRARFFARTRESDAGWSSLVARRAHNPKVAGSNPAPAMEEGPGNQGLFSLEGSLLTPPVVPISYQFGCGLAPALRAGPPWYVALTAVRRQNDRRAGQGVAVEHSTAGRLSPDVMRTEPRPLPMALSPPK
jgi:hypothetical protein